MTPTDLTLVERSWTELRARRDDLEARLVAVLAVEVPDGRAVDRAQWLVTVVEQLVTLLPEPSRLGRRARMLVASWPCPGSAPSFRVDGQAWMGAAAGVSPAWTGATAHAWSQAWLLLAEELAESSPSPFTYVVPAPEDT